MFGRVLCCLALCLMVLPAHAGKKLKYNDKEKEFLNKVDLIITLEERKIFHKKLTTHQERDRFIELFWAKRDPDLTDDVNPFRSEWMARYDYIMTHFNDHEFRQNSLNKGELFLLLGPPTDKSYLIDISLLGAGYRNAYTRFPPELWVYEDVGFDYKRRRLKVQFIATSAFGEFVAVTDRLTDHFLRTLKFKFIVNPDLEEPPVQVLSSADYQAGVAPDGEGAPAVVVMGTDEEEDTDDETYTEPRMETSAGAMPTAPPPTTEAEAEAEAESEAVADAPPSAERPEAPVMPPPPKTEALVVPSTLSADVARTSAVTYDEKAGNTAGIRARTGYFKSGADRRLLLGRLGFPLNNLEFQFVKNQYVVPFQLDYHLFNAAGKAVHGDSLRTEVAMPSKRALEKRTTWYSQEFAVIVPGDRYVLKAQLTELNTGTVSYLELPVEVPPLRDNPHATELVFMDPNVNPDSAKFNIRGTPFNLRLAHDNQVGDRLYPVTELVNVTSQDAISTIQIQALDASGNMARTWDLYAGEITNTNHGSFLLHPVLNTKTLRKGTYTLRIEVALTDGDLLLSEAPITLN